MAIPVQLRGIFDAAVAEGRQALAETEAKSVLATYGIRVPDRVFLAAGRPVEGRLDDLRFPAVAKVVSPTILHKTESGGVRLGLADAEAVRAAIDEMTRTIAPQGHRIEGWLVEEMLPKGVELVIGGTVDPSFGPTVMVGLGGILVELLEDVSFRLCPIDAQDAVEMLSELRGARLLRGWRGAPPVDEEEIRRALLLVGGEDGLMIGLADAIGELDINPLIVSEHGAVAADARIVLRSAGP